MKEHLHPEQQCFHFVNIQNSNADRYSKKKPQMRSFTQRPLLHDTQCGTMSNSYEAVVKSIFYEQ